MTTSEGEYYWKFYQEICGVDKLWRDAESRASQYRSMLEIWMRNTYSEEDIHFMQMSEKYPMIRPDEAGSIISEIKQNQ